MASLDSVLGSSYISSNEKPMDVIKNLSSRKSGEQNGFYVFSVDELIRRLKVWHIKLPRVQPFYAVKCNNHPAVLKTLALLGAGFDCASKAEIMKVMSYGVDPSRIVYAHPCKIASHLKHARTKGVKLMTFDCEDELYKIAKLFPDAELLIRIRCDAAKAQCELGIKFGVMPEDARKLLIIAARLKLSVVGVSFHVGSGCSEPSVFERAIFAARQVFTEAKEEGHSPNVLDIGGGFLGTSLQHLDEASLYVNAALEEYFPEGDNIKVIAEPGRYMVAAAFTLATPIVTVKEGKLSSQDVPENWLSKTEDSFVDSRMYYIDDGLYGSFNCVLYDHQVVHPLVVPRKARSKTANTLISTIWGPTCDGFDQVLKAVKLPALTSGEWLAWENMGAYTLAAAGNFNGFSTPEVKVLVHPLIEEFLNKKLQELNDCSVLSFGRTASEPKCTLEADVDDSLKDYITAMVVSLKEISVLQEENSCFSSDEFENGDSSECGDM